MPDAPDADPRSPDDPLRIAWLVYRGNPHCGGQGVYTRYVAREVAALGHHIEVLSGQPYPQLDDPDQLVEVPGLDLYRQPDPFRVDRCIRAALDALADAMGGGKAPSDRKIR